MGLLDTLERSIERVVRGAFSGRGGSVGPVEIATAVRRHMDRESSTAEHGAALAPNLYKIRLSEHDFAEAKKYGTALAEELCDEIIRHAESQGYTLLGPVKATFVKNTELRRGQMSIETQTDRTVKSSPPQPQAGVPRPPHAPSSGPAATAALPAQMARNTLEARSGLATLEHDGRSYTLEEQSTVIGRSSSADITISDTGVSRKHLEVASSGNRWVARDLGSTNGAYVDGQELRSTEAELFDGAVITLGNARMRFRLG
ncbi:FhaA domain-containing protein [Nesterenkonia natronophila]|uniref:DUF2662 domain-containing protein n=1 Tax=Nesterenkonia natronophila TaxID=2174932 RepID=A0A3A4G2E8_9MICC|nr:DUF3662 and FHA domain-containing protein [Nesterenkonia natronophila]RJN32349.1 DUF2662 domain-containing protein [Nesterenkonia natronophila]